MTVNFYYFQKEFFWKMIVWEQIEQNIVSWGRDPIVGVNGWIDQKSPLLVFQDIKWQKITTIKFEESKSNFIRRFSFFSRFLPFKVLLNTKCFVSKNMKLIRSLTWLLSNELKSFANISNLYLIYQISTSKKKFSNYQWKDGILNQVECLTL